MRSWRRFVPSQTPEAHSLPAQVLKETAAALDRMDACSNSCWLWPSITQRSYQTAEILGALFGLTRSRIVPEFSFLDPR